MKYLHFRRALSLGSKLNLSQTLISGKTIIWSVVFQMLPKVYMIIIEGALDHNHTSLESSYGNLCKINSNVASESFQSLHMVHVTTSTHCQVQIFTASTLPTVGGQTFL